MGYEALMCAVKVEAEKKIRYAFQEAYPHYTPPRDASAFWWGAWVAANLKLYGEHGFRERFPKQAEIVRGEVVNDYIAAKLAAIAYGEKV
jgi:hypothetical protein